MPPCLRPVYLENFLSSPDFHTFPFHFRRTGNLPRVLTTELPLEQKLRKCSSWWFDQRRTLGHEWGWTNCPDHVHVAIESRSVDRLGNIKSEVLCVRTSEQWRLLRSSKEPENHRESRTCQCMQVTLELITSMIIIACSTKFLHHEYFGVNTHWAEIEEIFSAE